MAESGSRPLHLHTLESLIADLVSGRAVQTTTGDFVLPNKQTRSALEWYRKKGPAAWSANVTPPHGEDLVDAISSEPPELPALPVRPATSSARILWLKKLEAHRFAGIHKFGTPSAAPQNYVHEFRSPITLFEGWNGSGKTSLLNAVIWALTGEMLRPQREPETPEEFECWVRNSDESKLSSAHKLSSLTPLPNIEQYRPDEPWVLADTWVELTFVDETGAELPIVRRSISRSPQGKFKETPPDLESFGFDPIAFRIGTVMPGLLPLLRVGSASELGRAVSQLTGLSALIDLANHVRRAKTKIDKDFTKAKIADRDEADSYYGTTKSDLEKILSSNPDLAPSQPIPSPTADQNIENTLEEISKHFVTAKAEAFDSARAILGEHFDPADPRLLTDLEKCIGGAIERIRRPQDLESLARLNALRKLTAEELDTSDQKVQAILTEADILEALTKNPSEAARVRLYARVATWIADHPDPQRKDNVCVVCGGSLEDALDPVTGRPVKTHLHEAAADATLLSQTLGRWAENAHGNLMRTLPDTLRPNNADLPSHPCDLLRAAIVDELFSFEPFSGVLGELKAQTASAFDEVVRNRPGLAAPAKIMLPDGCADLADALKQLDSAIRFARWRHANDELAREILTRVFGHIPREGEPSEKATLTGKLLELDAIVKAAQPISEALIQCDRLKKHLGARRKAEKHLTDYAVAGAALTNLAALGDLADRQVDQLRNILRKDTAKWRSLIYRGAFPDTEQELVDTGMGRKGEIDLVVEAGGVSAPAQHVTNASALRASLVAFFLAFWEYVLKERGGLATLILDDPQELLDDENRERLAEALRSLAASGAQLILTSYDPRFCGHVSRNSRADGVQHFAVHPATRQQPVVRTTMALPDIEQLKTTLEAHPDSEKTARDFADECRVFLEAKLGDMFDDPAHSAWARTNPYPTLATFLQRLRAQVKEAPQGMFSAHVFRRFAEHPALANRSLVIELMNKAHHGRRNEIRAGDVAQCADNLNELLELAEQMYDECYRWRRRDAPADQTSIEALPALAPMPHTTLDIVICPDLAAFTLHAPSGESQEFPERLDPHVLDSTAIYYLRRPNFGFAAPAGSLAIVDAVPGPAADRRLVIARYRDAVYARRLVRGAASSVIGLTAEVPDPRTRTPKTLSLPESEVAIHQVVGIIFHHTVKVAQGRDEAVLVDAGDLLKRIEVSFRVRDESAVPLALEKQVVLGGDRIELDEIGRHKDALVALTLDDGASIFKRVGEALPGELSHLRQFESIGGFGASQILSIDKPHKGFRHVVNVRAIIGVLYHG